MKLLMVRAIAQMPRALGARRSWVGLWPLLTLLVGVVPTRAAAQGPSNIDGPPAPIPPEVVARDVEGRVTVLAVALTEPLVIDGLLNDPVYGQVRAISDFVQQEPREGQAATERTEVWIFFDNRNIYFAARCLDSQADRMVAREMRRDHNNIVQDDNIAIAIDTFYDRRSGFVFFTNPLGALRDTEVTDERTRNVDWNTVWDVKTARNEEGWTVEIVIPFKSLRYRAAGPQTWSVNLRRQVRSKNETSYLTGVPASYGPQGIFRFSSAATLAGLRVPVQSNTRELKPYAISAVTTNRRASPVISNDLSADAGFDAKYGVTKSLTLGLTYNTDFAQVEEDEQQVNLTRFSLFFPEKREFFLEGQGIFAFGGAQTGQGQEGGGGAATSLAPLAFFSRRIGLSAGRQVSMLAGARLTGRVGRTAIGFLNTQTEKAPEAGAVATNFTVVRIRRDILRRSAIGLIATHRSPRAIGADSNQVVGLDTRLAFFENLTINSYYARSRTPTLGGDPSSHLAQLSYGADRYGLNLEHLQVGEAFNPEIGFLRRATFRRDYAQARFSPRTHRSRRMRKLFWEASLDNITDLSGKLETREAQGSFRIEFNNGDNWTTEYTRNHELIAVPFTVAGIAVIRPGGYSFHNVRTTYSLASRRRVSGRLALVRGSFYDGTRTEASYNGRIDFGSQFSIEPRLTVNWIRLPVGEFRSRLAATRATFTVTTRMALSALVQYNSDSATLSSNVRFRWEYQPGSDLFVVYSDGRNTIGPGFATLENRSFVVKATRLFRF